MFIIAYLRLHLLARNNKVNYQDNRSLIKQLDMWY